MKRKLLAIFSITLFLSAHVFAQKAATNAPRRKATPVALSSAQTFAGEFDGQTYKNKFFGLKLLIPEDWIIQENQINTQIKEVGSTMVKGKNAQTAKALDAAIQRLTVLFTVSKDILGIENNAVMVLSAERKAPLMQIRNGEDYLRLTIQSFKRLQLPPDFRYSETIETEKLGSETFHSLDIQRAGFRQRFYAIHRKDYSLLFTLSFQNDKDLEAMKNILRKSDFAWK